MHLCIYSVFTVHLSCICIYIYVKNQEIHAYMYIQCVYSAFVMYMYIHLCKKSRNSCIYVYIVRL
jgi:hypothetical protein